VGVIVRLKTFAVVLFVVVGSPYLAAATYTTADCSEAAFQTAVNSASDGDTVQGPLKGGTATWTSLLDTHKSLILNGNGCVITLSNADGIRMWATNASVHPRITNFTFTGSNDQAAILVEGGHPNFRVDHNRFINLTRRSIAVDYDSCNKWSTYPTQTYGVVDHNTITNTNSYAAINVYGRNDNWFSDANWGTASAMYFEDNTVSWSTGTVGGGNQDAIDGEMGARIVFRYNDITDGQLVCHDLGSTGQARSCRMFERYNNTFHNDVNDSGAYGVLSYRGGNGFDFNNKIPINASGNHGWPRALSTQIYRHNNGSGGVPQNFEVGVAAHYVCSSFHGWCSTGNQACAFSSDCSGTCNFTTSPPSDAACGAGYIRIANIDGMGAPAGYPARDQMGVSKDDPTTHRQTAAAEPSYSWNLTDSNNGNALITGIAAVDNSNTASTSSNYILPNREYYQQVVPFTGATGVGVGLLSVRPASCTPKVGYWATDESKLYVCTATNTWRPYYTPYTYPHPLQGGGGAAAPAAPAGLKAVIH
jgi:hypothetical protein